ncbi:Uu.00g007330.m01.CDS01 [Anthostomella pinea]|uniref:Uu.00g007330.m01.CDS01 n=1 Tax=Anthostomella pinea TaxID=933095 RepID=A0AAI8VXN5_9PEZI|nr:Uu.00g007330.m01.CDS01 [Anthostomella pinea]
MAAAPSARSVKPEGLAAAILALTIAFFVLSTFTVILRTTVRVAHRCFGVDDGLMLAGLMLFMVDCGVVSYDTFVGLGTPDAKLNAFMSSEGIKYVVFWQVFYVTSLCCIKNAICTTLLRIAVQKVHRILVWSIIVISIITSLIGFVGVLTTCKPVAANWDPSLGTCVSTDVITNLSYLVSASSILTDWSCAILPIFILWKTHMQTSMKVSVGLILGLGAISTSASVSTIIRMPYLRFYKDPNEYLFHMGNVILWSIFECGVGLIAGSLPMLRSLFKRWLGTDSQAGDGSAPLPPLSFATFGGTPGMPSGRDYKSSNKRSGKSSAASMRRFQNPTNKGHSLATVHGGPRRRTDSGEWEPLDDTSSRQNYIMEHHTVRVEFEMKDMVDSPRALRRTDSTEELRKS